MLPAIGLWMTPCGSISRGYHRLGTLETGSWSGEFIMLELGFGLSAMKCSVEEVTQVTTDLSALVSHLRAGRQLS